MQARDDKKYCLPLNIQPRGLNIIPTHRNPQIETFAGIQTHKNRNLNRKISIAACLMARNKYVN